VQEIGELVKVIDDIVEDTIKYSKQGHDLKTLMRESEDYIRGFMKRHTNLDYKPFVEYYRKKINERYI